LHLKPKGFWKTLKKYSGNRKETPPVDIDTFFEYFKNLNFCEKGCCLFRAK
jgi:hypothetical protein